MPNFNKGDDAVSTAKSSSQQRSFSRTQFFQLADGEETVLRFLTDKASNPNTGHGGWYEVKQHQNIPTKPKSEDFTGDNYPKAMGAVCRNPELNPVFSGVYDSCYICDEIVPYDDKIKKPAARLWALAVVQEAVKSGGKTTYRNKLRTVTRKEDGKDVEVEEPEIVVCNMGWKNFFSPLDIYFSRNDTLLDRAFSITRSGAKTDTTYVSIGLDPAVDFRDDAVMAEILPTAAEVGWEQASDDIIEAIIMDRSSDHFYGLFFDPAGSSVPSNSAAPVADVPEPTNNDADEAELQSIASRIKSYDGAPA